MCINNIEISWQTYLGSPYRLNNIIFIHPKTQVKNLRLMYGIELGTSRSERVRVSTLGHGNIHAMSEITQHYPNDMPATIVTA